MTATEVLREEVKEFIDHMNGKTLRKVKAMLEKEMGGADEENIIEENWDDLPEELQIILEQSVKEGEEGKVISYEQVKEKYSQWFRK